MGEAKRRRNATPPTTRVVMGTTGEMVEARHGGDPKALHDEMQAMIGAVLVGRRPAPAKVPCNGCRECCYHGRVDVHPDWGDDMTHLAVERDDAGDYWLQKAADGACVHLGEGGCTIYEHRPRSCRAYDCRIYSLCGVLDHYDGDHKQPIWVFQPESIQSRAFMAACGLLGPLHYGRAKREGRSLSAREVAAAVLTDPKLDEVMRMCARLLRCTPAQQAELFGFDPRTITNEQRQRAFRHITGEG